MKAISHLERIWCALPSTVCISTTAVPANNVHAKMGREPCCQRRGGPVGQQVNQDVPQRRPLRHDESSTPSTRGVWLVGDGNVRTRRNTVIQRVVRWRRRHQLRAKRCHERRTGAVYSHLSRMHRRCCLTWSV